MKVAQLALFCDQVGTAEKMTSKPQTIEDEEDDDRNNELTMM